ncbi:hypothetical protein B0T18DRAFT_424391 [Schizothecium vesticola]|uniref:Uncharacterized protein n=1 Tax=Schizothecium vesticola TaxID=314040 RepID=A0AA40F9X9_9PEZI|nr:hypothetical protein B0T18DRAFT_424391 [Schizothecium vesticola]
MNSFTFSPLAGLMTAAALLLALFAVGLTFSPLAGSLVIGIPPLAEVGAGLARAFPDCTELVAQLDMIIVLLVVGNASGAIANSLASWFAALDSWFFGAIAAFSRLLAGEAIENFVEGVHDYLSKDVEGRARVGARHGRLLALEGYDRSRIAALNTEIVELSKDLAETYGRLPEFLFAVTPRPSSLWTAVMPFERKPATLPKMTALRRLLISRVDRYVLHTQVGIDMILDARQENDIIVKGLETEKFIRREKLATFKADIAHWKKSAGTPLPHHYFALLSSRPIPDIPPLAMEAEDNERLPKRTRSREARVAAASSPSARPEVAPAPPALELVAVAVAELFMAVSDVLTCQDAPQEDVVAGKDEPEDEDAVPLPEVTPAPPAHELAVVPFADPFVAVSDVVAIRDARWEVAVVRTEEVEETVAMSLMEWKPTTTAPIVDIRAPHRLSARLDAAIRRVARRTRRRVEKSRHQPPRSAPGILSSAARVDCVVGMAEAAAVARTREAARQVRLAAAQAFREACANASRLGAYRRAVAEFRARLAEARESPAPAVLEIVAPPPSVPVMMPTVSVDMKSSTLPIPMVPIARESLAPARNPCDPPDADTRAAAGEFLAAILEPLAAACETLAATPDVKSRAVLAAVWHESFAAGPKSLAVARKPPGAACTPGRAARTPGLAARTPGLAARTPGPAACTPRAADDDIPDYIVLNDVVPHGIKKQPPPPPPPSDSSESESESEQESAHEWEDESDDDDDGLSVILTTDDPSVIVISGRPAPDADDAPLFDTGAMASHKAAIKDDLAQAAGQVVDAELDELYDEFMASESAAMAVMAAVAADEEEEDVEDEADEWESDDSDASPPAPAPPALFTAPTDDPTVVVVLSERPDTDDLLLFDTGAMANHQAALAGDMAEAAVAVADLDRFLAEPPREVEAAAAESDADSDESDDSKDDDELEDVVVPQQTAEQAAQMDALGDILGGMGL